MEIRIHEETGNSPLDAAYLAGEVEREGFVVFRSGRLRQRSIAKEISVMLGDEISATTCETNYGNACMCVVDRARVDFCEVMESVLDKQPQLSSPIYYR